MDILMPMLGDDSAFPKIINGIENMVIVIKSIIVKNCVARMRRFFARSESLAKIKSRCT